MRKRRGRVAVTTESAAEAIGGTAEHFQEPVRTALIDFLKSLANSDPKTAIRCADNAAGILHQLSQTQQSFFLGEAAALSSAPECGPAAGAQFFLRCVDLPHLLDKSDLRLWIDEGKSVSIKNREAAAAYFARESASSISALKRLRRSVHIEEVGRILGLYCSAAGGRPVGVKCTVEAPEALVRLGHHLPVTDGGTIYLPEHLDEHPSHERNFDEYKVLAAHQAGYIEFGTFALDFDALMDHADFAGLAPKQGVEPSGPLSSHYELFFRLFDDRTLARDIFFAVEDGRVDCSLRDKYRGLAPALVRTALDALDSRPSPASLPLREALVESLIRLSISGRIEEILPAKALPVYRSLCAHFARILNRNATVNDSAVVTTRIYRLLKRLSNVSLQSEFCQSALQDLAAESDKESADTPIQGSGPAEAGIPESEIRPYQQAQPVPYRGQTSPELVQLDLAIEMLKDAIADSDEMGIPLTKEMLEELLKRGAKIKISQMTSKEMADTAGLFITDLEGLPQEKIRELTAEERKKLEKLLRQAPALRTEKADRQPTFYYDEWDYLIDDYRPRWCRLSETPLEGGSSEIALTIRKRHSALISAVRRRFERVRPEMLSRVRRLRSGEEIELDHVIEAAVDRRAGVTPSDRIYQKRERRTRDVATAFLLDMSASTDEWITGGPSAMADGPRSSSRANLFDMFSQGRSRGSADPLAPDEGSRRVIDIEREALVIMAEALESLGDEYAIYGFSGYGRDNVEFFVFKEFAEAYSERARRRIGAMKPHKSTRMGPAIRHAIEKLRTTGSRLKVLILLSDGYPQDFDYGADRSSRDYGLHDTAMALREAKRNGVHTYCVTVDQAGNDYLRQMCGGENYLVVKDPGALPKILPQVYRGLTV